MGRNARIGLFVLMGLVVGLARLIEVEVGKAKPSEEAQAAPSLLIAKPKPTATPHAKKTHRASEHAKHAPATPAAAKDKEPAPAKDAKEPKEAKEKDEPEGLEWPKGPVYTVKKGETLGVIAQKVLGTSKLASKLYEANAARIGNPNFVKPGTRIIVPSRDGARRD